MLKGLVLQFRSYKTDWIRRQGKGRPICLGDRILAALAVLPHKQLNSAGQFGRVGHRVLFRSVRSVLFRFLKGMFRSFLSFWRLMRRKKTQRMQRSFAKNGKERKERNVLLQRTEKNARTFCSFFNIYIDIYRYICIYI